MRERVSKRVKEIGREDGKGMGGGEGREGVDGRGGVVLAKRCFSKTWFWQNAVLATRRFSLNAVLANMSS